MKRFLLIILACLCVICFSACNNTTEPEVTEPEVTEPEVTEPEVTEPEVTEPEVTEPEVTEPEVTEPEVTEPEVTEPEVTEPEVTVPEVTEPEVTEPEVTEPEVTEPEVTEPEVTEHEVTEPEVTEPEVTEPEVTEPEVTEPEENKVYTTGALSFEYPKSWTESSEDGEVIITNPNVPGTNITVSVEDKNDYYDTIDEESHKELMAYIYEAMGMTVESITIERTENANGVDFVKIVVDCTMSGVKVKQTQFTTSSESKTYTIVVTELLEDKAMVDMVFDSVQLAEGVDKVEVPSTPDITGDDGANVFTIEAMTFECPAGWVEEDGVLYDGDYNGNNIEVSYEAKNDVYATFDTDTYAELAIPLYEAMGMTVTDLEVSHVVNKNGVEMTKITMVVDIVGMKMDMSQFITTYGDKTYTVTIGELLPDDEMVELVFDSIRFE